MKNRLSPAAKRIPDTDRLESQEPDPAVLRIPVNVYSFSLALLTVLAVTGFALMYHENSLAQWIIRLEGGVHNRGIVHRIAAVLLMANLVYHVFYMLLSREGKPELRELFGDQLDPLLDELTGALAT